MHKPYLIDGFKFDLRLYILLAGVNPLRIFIYKEGLARFATEPYESPCPGNLDNLFMHLTNYAINKDSDNFIPNTNKDCDYIGSKRSYTFVLRTIMEEFGEAKMKEVQGDINDLVIKTMCIAQPYLQHLYKSSQPDDIENQMCFQILGFDVMLDHNLKCQLLEVNQSPSFTTDSPLDYKIKKALIQDTIKILNLSISRKLRTKGSKKAEMQKRLLGNNQSAMLSPIVLPEKEKPKEDAKEKFKKGQRSPMENTYEKQKQRKKQQLEEKQRLRKKRMLQREKYEGENCGEYELIYPIVSYVDEFQIQEEELKQEELAKEEKEFKFKEEKEVKGNEEEEGNIQMTQETMKSSVPENLKEPWDKQQHYLMCMEKAKELWESFT